MKKIISSILAIGMAFCVTTSAFAATKTSPTFKSDTGSKLSIGVGKTYQFKITSLNGKRPTFVVPGKLFTVKTNGVKGKDYYFVIKAVGKVGGSAGIYINGQKKPSTVATITKVVPTITPKKTSTSPKAVPKASAASVTPKKPITPSKIVPKTVVK